MRRLVFYNLILGLALLSSIGAEEPDRYRRRWLYQKPPISRISVEGNHYFSDKDITKRLYSRRRSLWSTLKADRRTRVQAESPGRDTLEVKYLYITNGFLGVRVNEQIEVVEPDSSAHVRVLIDEGTQYTYGPTSVSGDFEGYFRHRFEKFAASLETGKIINYFQMRDAVFEMKTVLANNGYPYAAVDYVLDSAGGRTDCPIDFQIRPDSLVHFGKVSITGIGRYSEKTVRRESRIAEFQIYRRDDIIDTRRRLVEAGYFSTMNIALDTTGGRRYNPDVIISVRERKPAYTTFTTGIGRSEIADVEWDLSGGFGKRNFLGSRRYDVSASLKFAPGRSRPLLEHLYRIRYTEPWFLQIRMPLVLTAEWEPGVQDPELSYRVEKFGISVSTTKRLGQEYRGELGLQYGAVRIYGVPADEIQEIKNDEGLSVRRKLYLSLRRDSRDHIFIPRRGSVTDVSAEYYGGFLGGDDYFYKLGFSWSSYQVVWPGWISATRIKSGWAAPFGKSDAVHIDDRFYLGGANTVRGFTVNTLGPTAEDGTLLKSDFIAIFNQEFRWQTIQVFQFVPFLKEFLGPWPLWQSVFFDMGNGFRNINDASWRRLAYTYGAGIQIVSPAGPIRVDYARRIKTRYIDFDYHWHFTILYAF
ncbi:MAG: BamA/TamA family outer membrane protein [bacterium]